MAQIRDAISVEDPEWKFDTLFWESVLTCHPAPGFRALQNRTLGYWVKRFNLWQEMGHWDVNKVPRFLDGDGTANLLGIQVEKMCDIIKLFDPEGYHRIKDFGESTATFHKARINVLDILVTGVMLSRLIPSRHKLRFVFGVMDLDDDHALSEDEFAAFVDTLIRGLGRAFGIAENAEIMPSVKSTDIVARRLYARISAISAARLRDIYDKGDAEVKQQLSDAVKQRHGHVKRSISLASDENVPAAACQVLPFSVLQEWCFRVFKDPLALPYALAIERFCPERFGEVYDGNDFSDSLADWYLSHKGPVTEPPDVLTREVGHVLTRGEVILAREVLEYCNSMENYGVCREDLESRLGTQIGITLWQNMEVALLKLSHGLKDNTTPRLFDFLQLLCPVADSRHLRMFDIWYQQYDELAQRQQKLGIAEVAAKEYKDLDEMTVWADYHQWVKIFKTIDKDSVGHITADDIVQGLGVEADTAKQMMMDYDVTEDGYIDLREFLRMMCPEDCRMPDEANWDDEKSLFGKLLRYTVEKERAQFDDRKSTFKRSVTEEIPSTKHQPGMEVYDEALPEVDEAKWVAWNEMFDRIDTDNDQRLIMKEMVSSGLVTAEVSEFLASTLDPKDKGGFSRHAMLEALLRAHKVRRHGFFGDG